MATLVRVEGSYRLAWPRWLGRPTVAATLLAGGLSVVWALWLAHDAGDLAAQYAWTAFVGQHPGSADNLSWYGGMHPASYSILSPYVMAWIGVRTTGVLACTAAAALGTLLLVRSGVPRPLLPALCLAVAVWCNIASGRVTYTLGMAFALGAAVLVLDRSDGRWRSVLAALLSVVATMGSPVAGLFIEVLAAALFLVGRRRRAYLLVPGPPLVIGATTLLFPFYGVQPFPWYSAVPTLAAAAAVAMLVPRTWRLVRAGAWVYAVGVVLCWVLPTPIGSNVERLALLAGAAILVCAVRASDRRRWTTVATWAVVAALTVWTVGQPVADLVSTAPDVTAVGRAQPLIAELLYLDAEQGRVEVVPLRSHWEAAGLAPYVDLARGWNRQADVERNPLFYNSTLTADSYHTWLRDWSVRYVVQPAEEPDSSGLAEAKIITSGTSWLHLVWGDADWRVYQVEGTDPLAASPATVSYAGSAALTLTMPRAGSVLVRVAWSPWLAIDGVDDDAEPRACLARNGDWTELTTPQPGTFTIEARYALDRGTPCPTSSSGL